MSRHNHTPWAKYRKALTTGGYSVKLIDDTMDGLVQNWVCPKCLEQVIDLASTNSEPAQTHTKSAQSDLTKGSSNE